jgi:predicted RND superfamily exporter protein
MNLLGLLFPTLILVVGMSDFVHIYSSYSDRINQKKSPGNSISKTLKEIGKATLITSIVSAVGFLTLFTSPIAPIRSFGVEAATGIMMTFFVVVLFGSVLLYRIPAFSTIKPEHYKRNDLWARLFEPVFKLTKQHKSYVITAFAILVLASTGGIFLISQDSGLLCNFRNDSKIVRDARFFEAQYGGTRSFEMKVESSEFSLFTNPDYVETIFQLDDYLSDCGINNLVSPATLISSHNMAMHGGAGDHLGFPADKKEMEAILKYISKKTRGDYRHFITGNGMTLRFSGIMKDPGRVSAGEFYEQISGGINKILGDQALIMITGYPLLYDEANRRLVDNILFSLFVVVVVVGVIMGLLFRKPAMVLIFIISNLIPLLAVGGILGYSGLELHGSLAIIFVIGFVLACDDSIHFLSHFKLLKDQEYSLDDALKLTMRTTGKPILITTLIICFGFLVLFTSSFMEIIYYAIFLCIISVLAFLTDILLVPVLLRFYLKD